MWGRLVADAEGRAEGELAIDTPDAAAFIALAADLGALPPSTVPLAAALLEGLAGVAEAKIRRALEGEDLA